MDCYAAYRRGDLKYIGTVEEMAKWYNTTPDRIRLLSSPEVRWATPWDKVRFFPLGDYEIDPETDMSMRRRDLAIAKMRDAGVSLEEIAETFTLSVDRVASALARVDNGRYLDDSVGTAY